MTKKRNYIAATTFFLFLSFFGFRLVGQNLSFPRNNKENTYQISGVVFKAKNANPLKNAKITVFQLLNNAETDKQMLVSDMANPTFYTNSDGAFSFNLQTDKLYEIEVSAQGYITRKFEMGGRGVNSGEKIAIEVPLKKGETPKIEGIVRDYESNMPISNAMVDLYDLTENATKSIVTGKEGSFSFTISPENTFELLIQKHQYFEKTKKVIPKEEGVTYEEVLIEKVNAGEKIVLETFFFSVNSHALNEEKREALETIEEVLITNPNVVIEIGCHSDARGDDQYNLELSQKRADAIMQHLIAKGVEKNRLIAKGYGETELVNDCVNGVKCSNEKHKENRRIVLTIIGVIE